MRCKIAKVRSKRQYLTMFLTSNFQEDLRLILYCIIHYKLCLVSHSYRLINAQSFKILKLHDQSKPNLKCRTFYISIALILCNKEKEQAGWLGIRIRCPIGGLHVYPQTVVSVSQHYDNPAKGVALVENKLTFISLKLNLI